MKFEDLLKDYIGEWGPYQRLNMFLVTIPTMLTAMHSLSWTFSAASINHRCILPNENVSSVPYDLNQVSGGTEYGATGGGNLTVPLAAIKCSRYVGRSFDDYFDETPDTIPTTSTAAKMESCLDGYRYDMREIQRSAVNEFEIVCGRGWIKAFIQSMYYVGQFLGSLFFGIIGDKFGRKIVFMAAIIAQSLAGALMAFVPNWILFALLRVFIGFCHPGIFVIAVVIGLELVGPKDRKLSGVITHIFYAVGQILLGLEAYQVRNYKHLQLIVSLPGLIFVTYWWLIPESARWLISQKRWAAADKILRKAAIKNGRHLPENWWENFEEETKSESAEPIKTTKTDEKQYGFLDLFRIGILRKRIILCYICWPVVSGVYYGLSMNPTFLGGHRYYTFMIAGVMEVPGLVFCYFTLDRWGRKTICQLGYAICALALFSTLIIPDDIVWLNACQVLISKGAITAVYATVYTFTPELFPTPVRNTALGSCSMIARVGAVSASYASMWLVEYSRVMVVLIFASCSLAAFIASLFLPETAALPLPETIDDLKHANMSFVPKCWQKQCSSSDAHSTDKKGQRKEIEMDAINDDQTQPLSLNNNDIA